MNMVRSHEARGSVGAPPPLEQGDRVRSYGAHGSVGALPCREVESGAIGHVTALEPSRMRGRDLEL
jgi:hypothetical protein